MNNIKPNNKAFAYMSRGTLNWCLCSSFVREHRMMLWAEPTPAPAGGSRPAAIASDPHTLFDHRSTDTYLAFKPSLSSST